MKKLLFAILALACVTVAFNSCSGEDEAPVEYVLTDGQEVAAQSAPPLDSGGTFHAMETHIVPGRLVEIFNDTNDIQLQAAIANGIDPITDLKGAYNTKQPLVKVSTCKYYYVDSMRYAFPYLVPKAAQLLSEIGMAFQDTIKARGGKEYRIRANSLLRSEYTVKHLSKVNRAASQKSCHMYGTTFDISFTKFDCMDTSYQISEESLKNILAEIIYDFRKKGKCYCIFEGKRGCFHVTVR